MSDGSTRIPYQRSNPVNSPSEVRVAYPYFHEKRTKNSAGKLFVYGPSHPKAGQPNPRFSGTFMFPKLSNDPSQCSNYMFLWNLAQEAAKKMWPQSVDAMGNWTWPAGAQFAQTAVKDGDIPFTPKPKPGQPLPSAEEIARKNEWRKGYWIVEAENFFEAVSIGSSIGGTSRDLPAKVINGVAQYKGGDWGYLKIHAYAYQNETFGVNFGFDGFWFTREGEQIGSSSGPKSASDMFAGIVPPAAPVGGPPPMTPAAPVAPQYTAAPPVAPTMAPPPPSPAPQYAAPPAAPSPAPQYAAPPPPPSPAPAAYVPPPVGGPPMPPAAPVASAPGLPPFPGR